MIREGKSVKIVNNSILLYIRMMVVMFINLYTVRIVLSALGETDYGIYNVVAGVITMLNGVTTVLASATQRYYSYSIGENNHALLPEIFSTSTNIFAIASISVIILGETIGLWFLNTQLVIPPDRLGAANWIYQFSILSFVFSMMKSPFSSAIIANENMGVFAIISFCDCLLRFGVAWLLLISPIDKLIFYGGLMLLIHFIDFGFNFGYCRKNYDECRYVKISHKDLYKKMFSFSGWTFFGSMAGVCMNQFITLLVNIFFGPTANAARAIAMQINGALSSFCGSFIMAVRPPMIKSYAEHDYSYLNKLFSLSNKFTYYCMLFIVLPLYIEMEVVLDLWLGNSSEQMCLFSRLILIYAFILSLNNPITIIMQAADRVKQYYIFVEVFTLLCPVIVFVLYKVGCPVESAFWCMICSILLSHFVRIWCINKYYSGFNLRDYVFSFIIPAIIITIIDVVVVLLMTHVINDGIVRMMIILVVSFVIVFFLAFLFGISKEERLFVKGLIKKLSSHVE